MSLQQIYTDEAPAVLGPYSQAILVKDILYISGQLPIDPKTGKFVDGDIQAQTHMVMKNLQVIVKKANIKWEQLAKCTIFLKNMADFPLVNEVYASYFGAIPPARETIEVARLPLDSLIEISAIAVA